MDELRNEMLAEIVGLAKAVKAAPGVSSISGILGDVYLDESMFNVLFNEYTVGHRFPDDDGNMKETRKTTYAGVVFACCAVIGKAADYE